MMKKGPAHAPGLFRPAVLSRRIEGQADNLPGMRRHLVVVSLLLSLSVAACGRDEQLTSGAVETTTTAVPEVAPPVESSTVESEVPATTGVPLACPQIGFTPNSDDVASQITTTGSSCEQAAQVVSAVKGAASLNYESQGFQCSGVEDSTAVLATVRWTCVNGLTTIAFIKT